MKKVSFLIAILLIQFCALAGTGGNTRKVLIITLSGTRPDALVAANTPNIDALISGGFYTYDSWSQERTVDGPAISSIFTGVYSPKHGVTNNSYVGSDFNTYPYFNTLAKQVNNSFKCVQYVEFWPASDNVSNDGWDQKLKGNNAGGDGITLIQDANTDVLALQFDAIDLEGHTSGFDPNNQAYLDVIEGVDQQIGNIINAMRNRPNYAQEDWLVLVVSPYAGDGTSHGGSTYEERRVFWIGFSDRGTPQRASGPQNGSFTNPVDPGTYDLSASVNLVTQRQSPVLVDIGTTALHHLIYDSGIVPENNAAWDLDGKSWLCAMGLCDPPITATINAIGSTNFCQGDSVQLNANVDTSYSYQWYRNGVLLPGATNDVYFAKQTGLFTARVYTATQGDTSVGIQVTVNPSPTVVATVSPNDSVCQGNQISLAASGANSYVWTNGVSSGVPFTVNNPGFYIVSGTAANGCVGLDTVNITVIANPASQAISGNTTITPLQTYFYTVGNIAGITYNWVATGGSIANGQGTNAVNITWNASGPYGIVLTQANVIGCSSTSNLTIVGGNNACTVSYSVTQSTAANPLCSGDTVLLTVQASAGVSLQWYNNGTQLSTNDSLVVTTSGQYQVRLDSAGCTALSNATSLTFQPVPATPTIIVNGQTGNCSGALPILSVSNTYNTYLWSTGANSPTLALTQSGTYGLEVSNVNGCKALAAPVSVNLSIVPQYDICIVSVDSATNKNVIVWEKQNTAGIDSFYLYKETNQLNVFNKIGAVGVNDFSTFIDQSSNPAQQADRYTIAVLDTCGNVSLQSTPQQTIHLTSNLGLGGVINLIWNAYSGFTYPSYNIYRSSGAGGLQLLTTISAASTSFTDTNPPAGLVYYQVGITNPNGCSPSKANDYSSSLSNLIEVNTVGVAEIEPDLVSIYPNPATDVITISTQSQTAGISYVLIDLLGRVILQENADKQVVLVPLAQLNPGMYLLQVNGQVYKVIKE